MYTLRVPGTSAPVSDHASPTSPARSAQQQAAARLSLVSNLLLVIIKIGAGIATHSVSILAEAVQSGMDVIASTVILLTVRAAAAPPDQAHPYGHGKFENVASLGQMVLILGTAGYLFFAAWHRLQLPEEVHADWGMLALAVTIGVNLLVSRRLFRVARDTDSQAILAEATHLRSDLLSCTGVLVGLAVTYFTHIWWLDPAIAIGMTVLVVVTAVRLLRDTLRPLLDESLPPEEEQAVRRVLESDERVWGYHRLRTRRAGSHRLVDVHILLDDRLTFPQAHAVGEDVEGAIREALPNTDVIVHAEPYEEETRHQREDHGTDPEPGRDSRLRAEDK